MKKVKVNLMMWYNEIRFKYNLNLHKKNEKNQGIVAKLYPVKIFYLLSLFCVDFKKEQFNKWFKKELSVLNDSFICQ